MKIFKTLLITILLIAGIAGILFPLTSVDASVYVHGYTRRNGTYVMPHYRSDPDRFRFNNWSYPGNFNPYTGITAGHTNLYHYSMPKYFYSRFQY